MKNKKFFIVFTVICIILGSLYLLQELLMPKYVSTIVEGSLIEEYYKEAENHDVVFIVIVSI